MGVISGRVAGIGLALGLVLVALVGALVAMPRGQPTSQITDRWPGWTVVRVDPAWEGAQAVVIACGGYELGFQWVTGHGLPDGAVQMKPRDSVTAAWLEHFGPSPPFVLPPGRNAPACR
jgi:hypothetical protein